MGAVGTPCPGGPLSSRSSPLLSDPERGSRSSPPYARLVPLEKSAFLGAELCLAGNSQRWVWEATCPVSADLISVPTPCPRVGHQRRTGLLCGLHHRWVEGPIPRLDPAAVKPPRPMEEEDWVGPGLHAPRTIGEGRPAPSAQCCSQWWLSLGNCTPGCHQAWTLSLHHRCWGRNLPKNRAALGRGLLRSGSTEAPVGGLWASRRGIRDGGALRGRGARRVPLHLPAPCTSSPHIPVPRRTP